MNLKQIRLAAGKRLLDKPKTPQPLAITNKSKILFVRYDGKIGDFIVSSFIYREIKRAYPGAAIHMVINASLQPLIEANNHIEKYFEMKGRSYYEIIKMAALLRRENYDVLIDPTPFLRNRDLLFIRNVNAAVNVGYGKESYALFNQNLPAVKEHTSQIYNRLLQALNITNANISYDLQLDNNSEEKVAAFFAANNITKSIAINFFGASRSRNILQPLAEKIITLVLSHYPGYTVILLTFPKVLPFTGELVNKFGDAGVVHFAGTKTIFDTASIIARVNLLISPDTSVIHIADVFKKPMLAMYSDDKENFAKWHPLQSTPVLRYSQNVNSIDTVEFEKQLVQLQGILNG